MIERGSRKMLFLCLLVVALAPAQVQSFSNSPALFWPGSPRLMLRASPAVPERAVASRNSKLLMSGEEYFEKDCVEFIMPPDMKAKHSKSLALGAIVDPDQLLVQPLCVREEGSTELYPDSRESPIILNDDQIVRIMDTYPSQRPIPSLGGGIGYGAEAVDCWELQEDFSEDCVILFEDTGMGFHQKGW
eukprot:CAMPEP_0181328810 /NCGR_PEP_ID=MMETSP1101-20121128/22944_1 /TAXON_ID=46948 /ORGANISM="Rhodomonas abbreviata, Strain Caron Lab Isolate" /LENGTH=188 /DNA_ID=CAMNT_0023437783 /DNA_START=3 /DNA_END=566 /DNA_ORIENTATION=+